MENAGDFITPRTSFRLSPGTPRSEPDLEADDSESGRASSSRARSPQAIGDDFEGGHIGAKTTATWSPSSVSTAARSSAWSARSSVTDSPIPGVLRAPTSRSFRSLDPEIASCLSKPLLDAQALPGPAAAKGEAVASDTAGARDAAAPAVGRTYWESILVVLPMYSGYAALFGLQHEIKTIFGIQDDNSDLSYDFSAAVSCLYVWSFTVRIGHNIFFSRVTPRGRVFISVLSMLLAVLLIAVVIIFLESHRMLWVVCAYSLGGIGIGCFESNFLSCLTPLGHETKHIAIIGIPTGITLVNVGGFFLMGPPWGLPPAAIYVAVAALILAGALVLALRIPRDAPEEQPGSEDTGLTKLVEATRQYRHWLPQVWRYAMVFGLDMFTLAAFCPGVILYVYDQDMVTLRAGLTVPTNTFIAIVSMFNMVGGVIGRWLSYRVKPRHPICYGLLTLIGVCVILLWVPLLAPFGTFLVMVGDGLMYGSITRHIDSGIPRQFNLIAISFWLLIGDVGSILGSNLIYSIRCWTVGH